MGDLVSRIEQLRRKLEKEKRKLKEDSAKLRKLRRNTEAKVGILIAKAWLSSLHTKQNIEEGTEILLKQLSSEDIEFVISAGKILGDIPSWSPLKELAELLEAELRDKEGKGQIDGNEKDLDIGAVWDEDDSLRW